MPSFNPFSSVTGRNSYSLFDIRLDQDFIVFRGTNDESAGQLLKGVVVLCLSSSLRIEDVHLRLTGTLRFSTPGISGQSVDKSSTLLEHRWAPFVGTHGKSMTLAAANYEYPFEFLLPGDTAESVEGLPEASITYRLKATVGRGKLAYDLHTYKHLRIIRTVAPAALELLHAMSVENTWLNKVDYSIVIPQKAVIFGSCIIIKMRFSPLRKGLELGEITVRLIEHREISVALPHTGRAHKKDRVVSTWRFNVSNDEHWHDLIEGTGQEGWTFTKRLDLPKRLRQCVQDVNHHGIKVKHWILLTVVLKNPGGHNSELRATLPVSIFISPSVPFDEQGDMVAQGPGIPGSDPDAGAIAPPGYGDHVLDQLYEDVDTTGFQTPGMQTPGMQTPGMQTPGMQSGVNSPLYSHSRTGSADNLAALAQSAPVTPAALSSRLADVSLDATHRNGSYTSMHSMSGGVSPTAGPHGSASRPEPHSACLARSSSDDDCSARNSHEHLDMDTAELANLSRVPSYATAVRTPVPSRTQMSGDRAPDYATAMSAPPTPPPMDVAAEHLVPITEDAPGEGQAAGVVGRPVAGMPVAA